MTMVGLEAVAEDGNIGIGVVDDQDWGGEGRRECGK
jgi:hypothetical protein